MNSIARDLAKLRHAAREADLDEGEMSLLDTTARMADLQTVDKWCSIMEKLWRAGYLARDAEAVDEVEFIHKHPGDSVR